MRIKAGDLDAALESLSGGNSRKCAGEDARPRPRVLIVDEPTRGVDVAAKQEIYLFLSELAAKGTPSS